MICQTCGSHSPGGAQFCPVCGSGLHQAAKPKKVRVKTEKKPALPKNRKAGYILLSLLAVLILAAFVGGLVLFRSAKYSVAVQAFETGDYVGAAAAFKSLGNYKDSEEKREEALEAAYGEALRLMSRDDYAGAIKIFSELGDYSQSKDQLLACNDYQKKQERYASALSLLEAGNHEAAVRAFHEILGYKDADIRWFQAAKGYYLELVRLYEAGDFGKAKTGFTLIANYPGAAVYEKKAEIALSCRRGNGEEAKAAFLALYQELAQPSLVEELPLLFKGNETVFSLEEWESFLSDYAAYSAPGENESAALRERRFAGCMKLFAAFRAAVQGGVAADGSTNEGANRLFSLCRWQFIDADGSILSAAGSAPAGKVLICSFAEGEALSGANLELSLMALLPDELLPSSLSEVEYLVQIIEGKDVYGYYDSGAIAYTRRVQVVVYKLPEKEAVKAYETVYGEDPPDVYTYSVWAPSVLGSSPDYSLVVNDVLAFIDSL